MNRQEDYEPDELEYKSGKTVITSIRLPPYLWQLLNKISANIGIDRSKLIRNLVIRGLEGYKEQIPQKFKNQVTRVLLEDQIQSIKDIKRIKHIKAEALEQIEFLERKARVSQLSETEKAILKMENKLVNQVNEWSDQYEESEDVDA